MKRSFEIITEKVSYAHFFKVVVCLGVLYWFFRGVKNKAKIGLFSWLNSVTGTKISFRFDFGVLLKVTYGLENCLPDICSQSGNKTLFSPGHLSATA